jgi:hypothetical protein
VQKLAWMELLETWSEIKNKVLRDLSINWFQSCTKTKYKRRSSTILLNTGRKWGENVNQDILFDIWHNLVNLIKS